MKKSLPSLVAVALAASAYSASANTVTFGTVGIPVSVSPVVPYVEDGITVTPTGHFDIGNFSAFGLGGGPANSVAVIHRGNAGEQVTVTFGGNPFNLLSVDITGWLLDGEPGLTGTFQSASGSHAVSFPATTTIDFTAISGFSNILAFTFTVPFGVGTCVPGVVNCANVGFDNIVLEAARGGEVPIPGALPLFATGLGALGFSLWRKKRKAA